MNAKLCSVAGRLVPLFLLLAPLSGRGEEVAWRSDYGAARQEASRVHRPMLIEFSTARCFWCRKLEGTTLRDPRVVRRLNEDFIPLHVDAGRDTFLPGALNIHSFPTLVLAGPDGRILQVLEGYQDAATLHARLEQTLRQTGAPVPLLKTYGEAASALARSDYRRAIPLLRQVAQAPPKHPVQDKARRLLEILERQASDRLTQAAYLEQSGQVRQAGHVLQDVTLTYAGTRAARKAGEILEKKR
jgi:thioredoxin-like negative regulator of GroEL